MKKILAIILALVICTAFAACEKKDGNVSSAIADGESSAVVSDEASSEAASSEKSETSSTKQDSTSSTTQAPVSSDKVCKHNFSKATCTEPAKCSLCSLVNGSKLGHNYVSGKCSRCGASDPNFSTYKNGGQDTIVKTNSQGSTNIKVAISDTSLYFPGVDKSALVVSRDCIFEADGWVFFEEVITVSGQFGKQFTMYKMKPDGSSLTKITTDFDDGDKGIYCYDLIGYEGGKMYYSVDAGEFGYIYAATPNAAFTDAVKQGSAVYKHDSGITLSEASIKDGAIYFTELSSRYNIETGKVDTTNNGKFKLSLDGKNKTKIG